MCLSAFVSVSVALDLVIRSSGYYGILPVSCGPGKNESQKYFNVPERMVFTTGDMVAADTRDFLAEMGRPYLLKPLYSGCLDANERMYSPYTIFLVYSFWSFSYY